MDNPEVVLVTGAGGFIGKSVAALLRRKGVRIVLADYGKLPDSSGQRLLDADVSDREQVARIFAENPITGVIHLASMLRTASECNPIRAARVNVGGAINLMEAAQHAKVKRFVYASSTSVYGTQPADSVVNEQTRAAPEDVYGSTKLCVERAGERYRNEMGFPFVALRISVVVGAGVTGSATPWRSEIFEAVEGPREITLPLQGNQRLSLLHVEDVALMLTWLCIKDEMPASTVYNAPAECLTVGQLKNAVARAHPSWKINTGEQTIRGFPQVIDGTRFATEFGYTTVPIVRRLQAKE